MSLGYAEKLSYREDVGTVGMPEIFDTPELIQNKIEELADMVQKSKHLVVFTGAGISTSSGIPDFRGPKGVWTLHVVLMSMLLALNNVDSLHLRSGFPREKLSELHGNSFKEICPCCKTEYLRDFEIETIGLKDTPRRCSGKNCGARLKDTVLDWEVSTTSSTVKLQTFYLAKYVILCRGAVVLAVLPAVQVRVLDLTGGISDRYDVCVAAEEFTDQWATPKDKKASLVIHGLVDKGACIAPRARGGCEVGEAHGVGEARRSREIRELREVGGSDSRGEGRRLQRRWPERLLLRLLGVAVRCSRRSHCRGGVRVSARSSRHLHGAFSCNGGGGRECRVQRQQQSDPGPRLQMRQRRDLSPRLQRRWTLRVTSIHGLRAPLPFIQSIEVSFPERPDMKSVELKEQPFSLQRETSMNRSFFMLLKLNFTDGCSCLSSSIGWPVDFQVSKQKDSFVRDKTLVIPELQCAAEHESCSGQQEILERESLPRAETAIHAIVTNVVRYDMGNDKISLPRDKGVNCSSSNSGKRNISGCYPAAPKKLKYFLKDEKLNC
nr:unnamed protein product [Digitaria exilis]